MKKLLFILIFLIPFSTFASSDYSKDGACKLKDGYFEKTLSVSYPGYGQTPFTFEFIKKSGKLLYFVHLPKNGSEITEAVYAYEYNCTNKKTRQIGDSLGSGLYKTAGLEGASGNWIVGHIYFADGCGGKPTLRKTLTNRTNGSQKVVDFSQYNGFSAIMSKLNFKTEDMGIQTFGSTSNPNVFNAVLVRNTTCGSDDYVGNNKTTKVVVDISNKTIKSSSSVNASVSQTINIKNYSISGVEFDAKKYIDSGYMQDRLEDIDLNGDKKPEKLISMVSQKMDRWKMKILSEQNGKWIVIKEDQDKRGIGGYDKNPFFLQIFDFGYDGKQEVIVSKISGVTLDARDRDIRYYVFGIVDGKYGDFPIPKGYLHGEWFESDSYPSMYNIELKSGKIVEKYSLLLPNQTGKSMADLQYYTMSIIQDFKKGSFLGNTQKQNENGSISNLF